VAGEIAIIGAGPAGSTLAWQLASAGLEVTLYDHQAPWEKPCGGMLGYSTFQIHPELRDYPYPVTSCDGILYESPAGQRKQVSSEVPVPVISRLDLNRFLLDRATSAGAVHRPEKVTGIARSGEQWTLHTDDGQRYVDLLVGADGVKSIVRTTCLEAFPDEHLALTCGYLVTGLPEDEFVTKFLDIEGYLFIISRSDHASVGIGARVGSIPGGSLIEKLDHYLEDRYGGCEILQRYAALLPSVTDERFYDEPCGGDNWLLLGDAAGHVNPASGEGIVYAIGSAKCAAEAIIAGDLPAYDAQWRIRYGETLKQGARVRKELADLTAGQDPRTFGFLAFEMM